MHVHGTLSVFGQQPSLQIYTQLCSVYSVPQNYDYSRAVETLNEGLALLVKSFPWLNCSVVKDEKKGYVLEPNSSNLTVIVKNLSSEQRAVTMDDLRLNNFSIRALDESVFSPRNTIPGTKDEAIHASMPVFLIQATFIAGGLVLTFVCCHSVMDMTGQDRIMSWLSKLCNGQSCSEEELRIGNSALDAYFSVDDSIMARKTRKNGKSEEWKKCLSSKTPGGERCYIWDNVTFSKSWLQTLKTDAVRSNSETDRKCLISTDDVLTAFIWQLLARARQNCLGTNTVIKLGRAVDPRRYVNVPVDFPGLLQNMTYHESPIGDLVSSPLGDVARNLRNAVDPATSSIGNTTKRFAWILAHADDKNEVSVLQSLDGARDMIISSWAKVKAPELDFNLGLGVPEAVRRPSFVPVAGLMYILPKDKSGSLTVSMCLSESEWEFVKKDENVVACFDGD